MIKSKELSDPKSCLNTARSNERLFVLLARDIAAPDVIRYWVRKRLSLGKNQRDDAQITEALECADLMEKERAHSPLADDHDAKTCWHCANGMVAQ